MLSLEEEYARLRDNAAEPACDFSKAGFCVDIVVECATDATQVANRVRSILGIVLETLITSRHAGQIQDRETFRVDRAFWADRLPQWFLAVTPFHDDVNSPLEPVAWTVESWLYWFLDSPEDRSWRWWGHQNRDHRSLVVTVQVVDLPFPSGALLWLLTASGATTVTI